MLLFDIDAIQNAAIDIAINIATYGSIVAILLSISIIFLFEIESFWYFAIGLDILARF